MESDTGRLKSCSSSSTSSDDRSISPSSMEGQTLKFTKRKGFTKDACACIVVTIVLVVLGAAAGIFFGLQYLDSSKQTEIVYKGTFKVIEGDTYHLNYADSLSDEFRSRADFYESKLNALFNNSDIKSAFLKSEVLALDTTDDNSVVVHFNLHSKVSKEIKIRASEIYITLANEVVKGRYSNHLQGLKIDQESIEIVERSPYAPTIKDAWGPRVQIPGLLEGQIKSTESTKVPRTRPTHPPRKCQKINLDFCSGVLPYNFTSYPNLVGHMNVEEILTDLIFYRQIPDSECYSVAKDFVCHLLQPDCVDDKILMPCRAFCSEFWDKCNNHIPESVKKKFNCEDFTKYTKLNSCWTKPGCVNELRDKKLDNQICDGIIDCADKSDEQSCEFCEPGQFMCGDGYCVDMDKRCDNVLDCSNGADESGCLSLAPNISKASVEDPQFYDKGYLFYNDKGYLGKICTDTMNNSLPMHRMDVVLRSLASTTCELLGFQTAKNIEMRKDTDQDHKAFVEMVDPLSSEVKFVKSSCPSRHVLYLRCSHLECGRKSYQRSLEDSSRNGQMNGFRSVSETDWPWHVTLLHETKPHCDASIISDRWLVTSLECFEETIGSEWTAQFGSVRHTSQSPKHKFIPINGIINTPYKDKNGLVLVQLKHKMVYSDRIMPVCLTSIAGNSSDENLMTVNGQCVILGWDDKDQSLQEIYVQVVNSARCPEVQDKEHHICVERLIENTISGCQSNILSGSPLMCNNQGKWFLAGINDTPTCLNRPSSFSKISQISQWVYKSISEKTVR